MKSLMKYLICVYSIVIVSLMLNCTGFETIEDCGKGSSLEVAIVSGTLMEPGGATPAKAASVIMRPGDYLAEIHMLEKRRGVDGFFTCKKTTDSLGNYSFAENDFIPEGAYCIEGRDGNGNCVLIDSIEIAPSAPLPPFLDTLRPAAVVRGMVPYDTNTQDAYVRVFGLDAYAEARSDGDFSLDSVPRGNLRIQILVLGGPQQFCDTIIVTAKAGDTAASIMPITFDSRGGSAVAMQWVNNGERAAEPSPPANKAVSFAGWFKEPACSTEWRFANDKVTAPTKLYAKWIVKDVDGNVYNTVKIGNQLWLVENLKTTRYNTMTQIPLVEDDTAWKYMTTPGYCWYNNDSAMKNPYGALYNWHAVNTGKLAPAGWRVSTEDDWDTLQDTLLAHGYSWDGTTDKTIAKALAAASYWSSSTNTGTIGNDLSKNNGSGFSALPAGYRNCWLYGFQGLGESVDWWTTRELNKSDAVVIEMTVNDIVVLRGKTDKKFGCSVRCVRDD